MNTNRRIRLMTLSPLGHAVEVKEIEELNPQELFSPGYAVLVAGRGVGSWFELLQRCRQSETEVIHLPSLVRGC